MTNLTPGANAEILNGKATLAIRLPQEIEIDVSAFVLFENEKVRGDDDMCFFNQPMVYDEAIRLKYSPSGKPEFIMDLSKVPADVTKIAVTATVDSGTFDAVKDVTVSLGSSQDDMEMTIPTDGRSEAALILCEIYKRNDVWKIRNVSQGFNGGLSALAKNFGVDIAEEDPRSTNAPAPAADPRKVDLAKRLQKVEAQAPALLSLVKSVAISLEKRGSAIPVAKVCLCLDISASMSRLFSSGKIDKLIERTLPLGLTFDDDGEVDVFLFGVKTHAFDPISANNYEGFSKPALKKHRLEGGTRYGEAMEAVRKFYAPDFSDGLPVFVFFVTDGSTQDQKKTLQMLKESSDEPIFWKFMGLTSPSQGKFLQILDDLPGRTVDNADYFNVQDPTKPTPEEFYDNVLEEFPEWLRDARAAGILK
jgi:stress response protein SCP2